MFRPSFLLIGIALGLLVGCEPSLKPSVPRRDVLAIVIDASSSARLAEGQTIADLRCQEAVAVVEQALHEPGLRQLDVLVLATGGTGTSNEGRVIIPWRSFASTSRLFGKNRSRATQQREFLQSLEAACRTALKSENTSPIFFAIERAATSLAEQTHQRSPGDDATVSRSLIVLSDLRENVHHGIKAYLVAVSRSVRRGTTIPSRPSGVPQLMLSGIATRICGLSEHAGGNADDLAVVPEAVTIAWKTILPDASFNASCRRPVAPSVGGAP